MSFPESQRIVFRENPLVEVISQLTFPTILSISSEAPAAFQEAVRDEYPLYERDDGVPVGIDLSKLAAELPFQLGPVGAVGHRFLTEDRTRTIALTRDFVAVTTTEYTRWESFRAEVERAKGALEEVYRPSFYSRIGLRYRDIVDRQRLGLEEIAWPELINRNLLGALGADEETIRSGVRAMHGDAVIQLKDPPDAFVRLFFGLTDEGEDPPYAVDADWFTAERSETDAVFTILDAFNRQAGDLFRWSITPRLRDALGSTDDQPQG